MQRVAKQQTQVLSRNTSAKQFRTLEVTQRRNALQLVDTLESSLIANEQEVLVRERQHQVNEQRI